MECRVEIPEVFRPYLDAALLRLGYLHPELAVAHEGSEVLLTGEAAANTDPKRTLLHLLYREKIYAETLALRGRLYESLGQP